MPEHLADDDFEPLDGEQPFADSFDDDEEDEDLAAEGDEQEDTDDQR
jgi:hypothetical protein